MTMVMCFDSVSCIGFGNVLSFTTHIPCGEKSQIEKIVTSS